MFGALMTKSMVVQSRDRFSRRCLDHILSSLFICPTEDLRFSIQLEMMVSKGLAFEEGSTRLSEEEGISKGLSLF